MSKSKTCMECRYLGDVKETGLREKRQICTYPEEITACINFEPIVVPSPAEDALKAEVERLKNELGIQKNLTRQACFEANRAYEEVAKWKEMFYDLFDKQAKVSTDPKVIVTNTDKEKGGEDEP